MLSASEAIGPRLLIVDKGTIDLVTGGEPAWVYRGGGGTLVAGTLGAGAGAVLNAGSTGMLHNSGSEPVVITIVAIHSGDAAASGG
jgi:hypothetical protein